MLNDHKAPGESGGSFKEIHIVGAGPTVLLYDWPEGIEKWTVASMFKVFGDRADVFFCMHGEEPETDKRLVNRDNFPLKEAVDIAGYKYFTCSIAYMIALAIMEGATKISLPGCDIDHGGEYEFEKPCVLFWIGIARGRGIEVDTTLAYSPELYGYNTGILNPVKKKLEAGKKQQLALINAAAKNGNEIEKAVHSGIYQGFEAALNMIKG